MANAKTDTIKITFKQDEKEYARIFRRMYSVPTAIIKDFIIRDVQNYLSQNGTQNSISSIKNVEFQTSNNKIKNKDDIDIII